MSSYQPLDPRAAPVDHFVRNAPLVSGLDPRAHPVDHVAAAAERGKYAGYSEPAPQPAPLTAQDLIPMSVPTVVVPAPLPCPLGPTPITNTFEYVEGSRRLCGALPHSTRPWLAHRQEWWQPVATVCPKQLAQTEQEFKLTDLNADGVISAEEWKTANRVRGDGGVLDFGTVDRNRDGVIDKHEYHQGHTANYR